jgi:hypothetical protein
LGAIYTAPPGEESSVLASTSVFFPRRKNTKFAGLEMVAGVDDRSFRQRENQHTVDLKSVRITPVSSLCGTPVSHPN